MQLDKIFRTALQYKASDVYISTGSRPILRINGDLVIIEEHPLMTKKLAEEYLLETMNEEQKNYFAKNLDIDFSLDLPSICRFRVNTFVQRKGISAVFRLIPENVYTLDELGLPEILKQITEYPNGLVIITGPTGSGKSTTLAAMINELNFNKSKHILTIEDPIEFIHENKKALVNQREIKTHTQSFAKALRSALREAPDIILIGEMRDLETISMAITAAETGHLVFASLHTKGAAKSVDRIIDAFPFEQQNQIRSMISESLKAIVWQNLVKTRDGKGRIAALEIMINNSGIANMIRTAKTHQINSAIETGFKEGMQTMKKAITDLMEADLITEEEALKHLPPEIET
jgi:twitching motility protein PilT